MKKFYFLEKNRPGVGSDLKDLSTLKSDIHIGLAALANVTLSGRKILVSTSLKTIIVYCYMTRENPFS